MAGVGCSQWALTTTMADGTFMFTDVKPGQYTVGESALTDTNTDGVPDVDQDLVLDPTTVGVTLTSGETESISYQWANYIYGSIHGVKFEDLDGDGIWDQDEPPLEGIYFNLYQFVSTTTQSSSPTAATSRSPA